MTVILMKTDSFEVIQLTGVTSITYNSGAGTYTVTHSGGTNTYSSSTYHINLLW